MNLQEEFNNRYLYENGKLFNKKTGKETGKTIAGRYYSIEFRINGVKKKFKTHRVIWIMHYGDIDESLRIDHINNIPTDNRLENLRLSTLSQNSANSIGYNKAGLPKGVRKVGKKYIARIKYENKEYYLGSYESAEQASEAYQIKAKEFHGEFAR